MKEFDFPSFAEPTRLCNRCIMDNTVPGIVFDSSGECNFCALHDQLEKEFPLNERGNAKLQTLTARVRKVGRKNKYDCVVGVSGGRDSSYTLYYVKEVLGLRPLAVHFNDGFDNPVAGENMVKMCRMLNVELRTITSDWRESKDLKIAYLKASTPDLGISTDIGIATALYGVAATENIKYILIGQSFRTEGIAPLEWNFLDGKYMESVHKQFGERSLRPWKANDPGFHLRIRHVFYYSAIRGIRTIPILYHLNYVRTKTDALLKEKFGWVPPGAHYADDLYQSLLSWVLRNKFNINRRKFNYSALVRSGQMQRTEAIDKSLVPYSIEDPEIIKLCIRRLGITMEEFESFMKLPRKTFRDYPGNYFLIRMFKIPIWILAKLNLLPRSAYYKYFWCG
jgi:N-acetyl sugar amidotransferase